MPQNIDVQFMPFVSGAIQRETLFELYRLLLHPHIEKTFGWNEADQQARFEAEHPNSVIKLIQIDTVFTGFTATRLDKNSLHITLLLLKPEFQGRGIGEKSMIQIQSAAEVLQLPVTLSCFTNNHRALAFYQRLGYRVIASDKNFVDLTNTPITKWPQAKFAWRGMSVIDYRSELKNVINRDVQGKQLLLHRRQP